MSEGGILTLLLTIVSAIIWAVRVEGIVRKHEQQIEELREDARRAQQELLLELRYIRQRIDEMRQRR